MHRADRALIRAFLGRMFSRAKPEQLVEIAWSDETGKPNTAKLFPCTPAGLDHAAEAAGRASDHGRNVYYGPNPRRAGTPTGKRSYDHHVEAALWQFVDGDTPEADSAYTFDGFPVPTTLEIQTGTQPHPRRHLYWELDEAEGDLAAWKLRQKALAAHYAGDKSVHNPSRIMRLPGTISYPHAKKIEKGYKVEPVEVFAQSTRRAPAAVLAETFRAAEIERVERVEKKDGTELERAIANLQAGIELHNNARTAVNGLLANGTPPAAVELMLTAMLGSVSDGGTLAQLPGLIKSAVAKGIHRDAPEAEFEVIEGGEPERPAPVEPPKRMAPRLQQLPEGFDPKTLPTRQFLMGRRFMRGAVTAGIGAPGVSKSTFSLLTAVAIASGRPLTGEPIYEQTNVCIYNAEDDETEIKRRVAGICIKHGISYDAIRPRLYFMSGTETPLFVAVKDKDVVRATRAADEVVEDLLAHDIGYLALDPLASLHNGVGENDNSDMNTVLQIVKRIAARGNCATDLVHHSVKNRSGNSEAGAGDMNTGRGASAVMGAVRFMYTLSAMSEDTAKEFGISPDEAMRYVCLMDAKSNYQLKSAERTWFRLDSVFIGNGIPDDLTSSGDSVGVHELRDLSHLRRQAEAAQEAREADRRQALAALIAGAMPSDECAVKDVLPAVMKAGNVKDSEARDRINSAIPEGCGVLVTLNGVVFTVTRKRKGEHANAPMLLVREREAPDAE
jgi:hypothetical protein